MTGNELRILLVEDDDVDALAVQRALDKEDIDNELTVAKDGVEALEMLRAPNNRQVIPRPHLILLDLNMPRMNGFEFLDEIRQDPQIQDSIVFVLTTSHSDADICEAYKKNVAGYLLKTNVEHGLRDAMTMVDSYWNAVELPR